MGWGKLPAKTCRRAAHEAQPQISSEIRIKYHIHWINIHYTCSIAWLHVTDSMSSAFRKTSDTGGKAQVRFAFVRNHTHKCRDETGDGEGPFTSPAPDQNPTWASFCLLPDSCWKASVRWVDGFNPVSSALHLGPKVVKALAIKWTGTAQYNQY